MASLADAIFFFVACLFAGGKYGRRLRCCRRQCAQLAALCSRAAPCEHTCGLARLSAHADTPRCAAMFSLRCEHTPRFFRCFEHPVLLSRRCRRPKYCACARISSFLCFRIKSLRNACSPCAQVPRFFAESEAMQSNYKATSAKYWFLRSFFALRPNRAHLRNRSDCRD